MTTLDHETVAALVSGVRQLAGTLLTRSNAISNLIKLVSGKNEIIDNYPDRRDAVNDADQGGKLLSAAKNNKTCYTNLQSLQMTLLETQRYFTELNGVTAIFLVEEDEAKVYGSGQCHYGEAHTTLQQRDHGPYRVLWQAEVRGEVAARC